jgi:uncharacterized membrane protein
MKPKEFLSRLEHHQIAKAIEQAEKKTSGEIRVFISHHEPEDALKAAQKHFDELGMHRAKDRNGVLIYVAPRAHKFAVIGDAGVHQRCGDNFWTALAAEMGGHFKRGDFTDGLVHAVKKAGELLAVHFPRKTGNPGNAAGAVEED